MVKKRTDEELGHRVRELERDTAEENAMMANNDWIFVKSCR